MAPARSGACWPATSSHHIHTAGRGIPGYSVPARCCGAAGGSVPKRGAEPAAPQRGRARGGGRPRRCFISSRLGERKRGTSFRGGEVPRKGGKRAAERACSCLHSAREAGREGGEAISERHINMLIRPFCSIHPQRRSCGSEPPGSEDPTEPRPFSGLGSHHIAPSPPARTNVLASL